MASDRLPDLGAELVLVWVCHRRLRGVHGSSETPRQNPAPPPKDDGWDARRRLLAKYLGVPSRGVRISRTPCGKPILSGRSDIHFNLTRSTTLEAFALSRAPVGVDLEEEEDMPLDEVDALAELVLSPAERQQFEPLTPAMRRSFYLRCWTRREAYLKAVGEGLSRAVLPETAIPESGAFRGFPPRTDKIWTVWEKRPAEGSFLAVVAASPVSDLQILVRGEPLC